MKRGIILIIVFLLSLYVASASTEIFYPTSAGYRSWGSPSPGWNDVTYTSGCYFGNGVNPGVAGINNCLVSSIICTESSPNSCSPPNFNNQIGSAYLYFQYTGDFDRDTDTAILHIPEVYCEDSPNSVSLAGDFSSPHPITNIKIGDNTWSFDLRDGGSYDITSVFSKSYTPPGFLARISILDSRWPQNCGGGWSCSRHFWQCYISMDNNQKPYIEIIKSDEPQNCQLTNAYWDRNSANEGDEVNLIVVSNGECNGQTIDFVVKESDFAWDDSVNVEPVSVTFGTGTYVSTTWTAEWMSDVSGDPEYYFKASLHSNPSIKINSINELRVSRVNSCSNDNDCNSDEVCCGGLCYGGDCCDDSDCSGDQVCIEHTCEIHSGLICSVEQGGCYGGRTSIFKMSSQTNAHAELLTENNYDWYVCCKGVTDTCFSGATEVLRLSSRTNAHVGIPNEAQDYPNSVCIYSSERNLICEYSNVCSNDKFCIVEISSNVDSHVGQCGISGYQIKVCCGYSGENQENCNNGLDDDNDGRIDCDDSDCENDIVCITPCDSNCDPAICHPRMEDCNTIYDDDCDGFRNENCDGVCTNGETQACGLEVGICRRGLETCVGESWNNNCVGAIWPGTEECDGGYVDEDCDGSRNEGCTCISGNSRQCGPDTNSGICEYGTQHCSSQGIWLDYCNTNVIYPGFEICNNNLDDDCDGQVDLNDDDCIVGNEICNNLIDDDNDGRIDCRDPDCQNNQACSGCNPNCAPEICKPRPVVCDNGWDEDCNGLFNCDDIGVECTQAECNNCDQICIDAYDGDINPPVCHQKPNENCWNGLDDDCDGLVDCDDITNCPSTHLACSNCDSSCAHAVCHPRSENCNNNLDDDCDGCTDNVDSNCGGIETGSQCSDGADNDCDGPQDDDDSTNCGNGPTEECELREAYWAKNFGGNNDAPIKWNDGSGIIPELAQGIKVRLYVKKQEGTNCGSGDVVQFEIRQKIGSDDVPISDSGFDISSETFVSGNDYVYSEWVTKAHVSGTPEYIFKAKLTGSPSRATSDIIKVDKNRNIVPCGDGDYDSDTEQCDPSGGAGGQCRPDECDACICTQTPDSSGKIVEYTECIDDGDGDDYGTQTKTTTYKIQNPAGGWINDPDNNPVVERNIECVIGKISSPFFGTFSTLLTILIIIGYYFVKRRRK